MGISSSGHMLICSLKFLCEHLFTFQFCALMPNISKENFAVFCIVSVQITWISLWLWPIMLSIGSETIGEVTNHPICQWRRRQFRFTTLCQPNEVGRLELATTQCHLSFEKVFEVTLVKRTRKKNFSSSFHFIPHYSCLQFKVNGLKNSLCLNPCYLKVSVCLIAPYVRNV